MPTSCAAFNCTNRHQKWTNVTFHKFPLNNAPLLKKLLIALRRDHWVLTNASRLCSDHFIPSDFRFLATGDSYMSASYRFRMAHNTISGFVPEICDAIYSSLQPEFLGFPKKEDWTSIAKKFEMKKQFPNCVGALDGKHVRIQKPDNSGSQYFNYKMYTSIVLMALVSADLHFIVIDVGSYGRNSDGGVFANSAFGKKIINKQIDFPDDKPLYEGGQPMPHVIVADEAFRLLPNLMKPYPRRGLTDDKRLFNFRLSHARSTVECAFGLLASKFRIFHSPISVKPVNVDKIIQAACVLHNRWWW